MTTGGDLKPNFLDEDFYPFEARDFSRERFTPEQIAQVLIDGGADVNAVNEKISVH
ncbi:MAG: hypothetical protein IJR35_04010 [Synergistaceae bacterium]|nr:hypothetical protein [Synergistaceae bacterium]